MTTLLAQLEATWRQHGDELIAEAIPSCNEPLQAEGEQLKSCADDLHATVAQLDCRTCRFAGDVNDHWKTRQCHLEDEIFSVEGVALADQDGAIVVPLTFNSQPFFCAAHTQRPTDTETK